MDQDHYMRLCLVCDEHGRIDFTDDYLPPEDFNDDTVMDFKVCCPECGQWYPFKTTLKQLESVIKGRDVIQNIYPDLDPGTREIVRPIGQYCTKCWDDLFGKMEE